MKIVYRSIHLPGNHVELWFIDVSGHQVDVASVVAKAQALRCRGHIKR